MDDDEELSFEAKLALENAVIKEYPKDDLSVGYQGIGDLYVVWLDPSITPDPDGIVGEIAGVARLHDSQLYIEELDEEDNTISADDALQALGTVVEFFAKIPGKEFDIPPGLNTLEDLIEDSRDLLPENPEPKFGILMEVDAWRNIGYNPEAKLEQGQGSPTL